MQQKPTNMVEIGMIELALAGGGFVFGFIFGKMNGAGPVDKSDNRSIGSHNTTGDDNRGAVQGDGNVSGRGKNVG